MTCTCKHIDTYSKQKLSVFAKIEKGDPTRTISLRNSYVSAMNAKFNSLMTKIQKAVVVRDEFGFTNTGVSINDELAHFNTWLRKEMDNTILQVSDFTQVGFSEFSAWTNLYIKKAYKVGLIRARAELKKAGYPALEDIQANVASHEDTIEQLLKTPYYTDRLSILYSRNFNELKGVSEAMAKQINIVLAEGLVNGDGLRVLGRKLNAVIKGGGGDLGITDSLGRYIPARRRAQMIARTEIVRTHHNAMIDQYEQWNVEGVHVKAEWMTAGDDRVCEQCNSMEGHTFTLEEIRGLIPAHPSCRCIALPLQWNDKTFEAKRLDEMGLIKIY